jgi:hypothetical protein
MVNSTGFVQAPQVALPEVARTFEVPKVPTHTQTFGVPQVPTTGGGFLAPSGPGQPATSTVPSLSPSSGGGGGFGIDGSTLALGGGAAALAAALGAVGQKENGGGGILSPENVISGLSKVGDWTGITGDGPGFLDKLLPEGFDLTNLPENVVEWISDFLGLGGGAAAAPAAGAGAGGIGMGGLTSAGMYGTGAINVAAPAGSFSGSMLPTAAQAAAAPASVAGGLSTTLSAPAAAVAYGGGPTLTAAGLTATQASMVPTAAASLAAPASVAGGLAAPAAGMMASAMPFFGPAAALGILYYGLNEMGRDKSMSPADIRKEFAPITSILERGEDYARERFLAPNANPEQALARFKNLQNPQDKYGVIKKIRGEMSPDAISLFNKFIEDEAFNQAVYEQRARVSSQFPDANIPLVTSDLRSFTPPKPEFTQHQLLQEEFGVPTSRPAPRPASVFDPHEGYGK